MADINGSDIGTEGFASENISDGNGKYGGQGGGGNGSGDAVSAVGAVSGAGAAYNSGNGGDSVGGASVDGFGAASGREYGGDAVSAVSGAGAAYNSGNGVNIDYDGGVAGLGYADAPAATPPPEAVHPPEAAGRAPEAVGWVPPDYAAGQAPEAARPPEAGVWAPEAARPPEAGVWAPEPAREAGAWAGAQPSAQASEAHVRPAVPQPDGNSVAPQNAPEFAAGGSAGGASVDGFGAGSGREYGGDAASFDSVGGFPAAQPAQPVEPMQPVQSAQAEFPAQPMQPVQPVQAELSAQPIQLTQPAQAELPAQPMQPAQPVEPMQPMQQPAQAEFPAQPMQPVQVELPVQPVQPTQQPAQAELPVQPVQQPAQAAQAEFPAQPMQPMQPAQAELPVQPTQQPAQAAQAALPAQAGQRAAPHELLRGAEYVPGVGDPCAGQSAYPPEPPPMQQFYTESIKKRAKKRKSTFLRYLLASAIGVVLGGALVFLAIMYFWPALSALPYFPINRHMAPGAEITRKYEIERVGSPVEAIYEKVSPSIVGIKVTTTFNDFFFGEQDITGEGSGIIIREDGYILTNNHVITGGLNVPSQQGGGRNGGDGSKLEVILPSNKDKSYPAKLVGRDLKTDLAVLKIEAYNLPAAELGDSDALRPGELVVAIGSPGGLDYMSSVTDGIVSGLNRMVETDSGDEFNLIQTNAAINPGNSGGALVNAVGQVIGINTIKVSEPGFEGLGFAIPINSAREVADSLIVFNYVKGRPKIGIFYNKDFNSNYEYYKKQHPDIPKGVLVDQVEPLSGAFKAGVREGDIITSFNGAPVESYVEMNAIRDTLKPGDIIDIEVYRDGATSKMELELSEDIGELETNQ